MMIIIKFWINFLIYSWILKINSILLIFRFGFSFDQTLTFNTSTLGTWLNRVSNAPYFKEIIRCVNKVYIQYSIVYKN